MGRESRHNATVALVFHRRRCFADGDAWRARSAEPGIDHMKGTPNPARVATEDAIWDTVAEAGRIAGTEIRAGQFPIDDAGQFNWMRCRAMSDIFLPGPITGRHSATGATKSCGDRRKTGTDSCGYQAIRPGRSTPTARRGTFAPKSSGGQSLSEPAARRGVSPSMPVSGPRRPAPSSACRFGPACVIASGSPAYPMCRSWRIREKGALSQKKIPESCPYYSPSVTLTSITWMTLLARTAQAPLMCHHRVSASVSETDITRSDLHSRPYRLRHLYSATSLQG